VPLFVLHNSFSSLRGAAGGKYRQGELSLSTWLFAEIGRACLHGASETEAGDAPEWR